MAGLFAAKSTSALSISSITSFVAHRTAHEADARFAAGDLEADVAHDGCHDHIPAQPSFALKLPRAHQQDGVAVDHVATVVHEDRTVAVAIERHAHVTPAFDNGARKPLGMRRSTILVDISSIGLIADDEGVDAQTREELGRYYRRGAIRTIDGELEIAASSDASGKTARK